MKALVVYGTRSGATKQIADEIGKTLEEQGYATTVRDAKQTNDLRAQDFDLVIVGSSIWATMWKRQTMGFLKRNRKALAGKKVALFSSGLAGGDPAQAGYARKSVEKVAAKFPEIRPISMACFGGLVDFDSPNFLARFMAGAMKKDFEKKGVDTSKPVDTRDWAAIRQWAEDVAVKAR
ncbi:MAG TPA: flavodoxin domain-containing protein [Methanocella sp.]|nr:flavodoxin domain-containing protein [Methanocella sp.]